MRFLLVLGLMINMLNISNGQSIGGSGVEQTVDISNDNNLKADEAYVILFQTDSIINKEFRYKDVCILDKASKTGRYYLVRGRIIDVIYMGDTNFYSSHNELKSIQYILISKEYRDKFKKNKQLLISVSSTPDRRYLAFEKLRYDKEGCKYINYPVLQTQCGCPKKGIFKRKQRTDKASIYINEHEIR